ncbi:MAG: flippase [Candidatus Omnitrophica bacterium]|jgi:PST family polysaccharide transporter|nr:flippase [Candidatus Omnitrophota bacterium]
MAKNTYRQEVKTVLENFFSLSSLQGVNYVLPLIVLPYLIRVLGPEKIGLIAFAQSFVQYFVILTDYGFNLSATRQIALYRERKEQLHQIFTSVLAVKLILVIISFFLMMLIVNLFPRFKQDWLIYALSFGAVLGNALFPSWLFQGTEKMKYTALLNIACGILYAASIIIFIKKPQDFLYVPLFNSIFFILTGLLGLFTAFKMFNLSLVNRSVNDILKQLKTGWDYFISVVAINTYTASRVFAVGLLTNNTFTGYYAIAEKIAGAIQTFPLDSLSQAVYPRFNKIFQTSKNKAFRLMNKVQNSITITYLVIIPLCYFSAHLIVKLVCGNAYSGVVSCLRLLLISVFFVVANALRVQFLLVCARQDLYSKIHIAAAIFGLPLTFIMIFYYSYQGAALSTILIEIAVYLSTAIILKRL